MTQTADVLAHLRKGKTLTPLFALNAFGCFRLGARIYDLRKRGFLIHMERAKGKKHFAIYRLIGGPK